MITSVGIDPKGDATTSASYMARPQSRTPPVGLREPTAACKIHRMALSNATSVGIVRSCGSGPPEAAVEPRTGCDLRIGGGLHRHNATSVGIVHNETQDIPIWVDSRALSHRDARRQETRRRWTVRFTGAPRTMNRNTARWVPRERSDMLRTLFASEKIIEERFAPEDFCPRKGMGGDRIPYGVPREETKEEAWAPGCIRRRYSAGESRRDDRFRATTTEDTRRKSLGVCADVLPTPADTV